MPHEMLLFVIVMLPFVGSCLAALLPSNARNAEAGLAGALTVVGLALILSAYPAVIKGKRNSKPSWMAARA